MSEALYSAPHMAHFSILASVPVAEDVVEVLASGVDDEQPATTNKASERTRIF